MTGELVFAFVAGSIATANPCGFALLPAFLAGRLQDGAADAGPTRAVARALAVGAVTTVGFLLVFGTIGSGMSLGARWLTGVIPWVALAIGVALVFIGVALLAGRRIPLRLPVRIGRSGGRAYGSGLLFGVGYGVASLACTLPIFLVVVAGSLNASTLAAPLMFAAYAAGMGTILTALAVAAALSRTGLRSAIRAVLPYVDRVSAVLLILAGAYVVWYWALALFAPNAKRGSQPIELGSRLSSAAQTWLGGGTGKLVTLLVAAALAALVFWVLVARVRAARRAPASTGLRPLERLAESDASEAAEAVAAGEPGRRGR